MSNPVIYNGPCLRCGWFGDWKRNKAGRAYLWCTSRGGCGAIITLGVADRYPESHEDSDDRREAEIENHKEYDRERDQEAAAATQPEPEPLDDGRERERDPKRDDDSNPWGLLG